MAYFRCKGVKKAKPVTSFSVASWSTGTACAYWGIPSGRFNGVRVMYKTGSAPTSPTDGTLFYEGSGSDLALTSITTVHGATKSGFTVGTTYYFSCFSYYTGTSGSKKYNTGTYLTAQWTSQSFASAKEFTYTQDWTVPTGVRSISIFIVGGGGNSGSWTAYNGNFHASGGGGGASCISGTASVTPGQSLRATIAGAAGASSLAGVSAGAGGTSGDCSAWEGGAGGSGGTGGGTGGTGGWYYGSNYSKGTKGTAGTTFNGVNFAAGGGGGYNTYQNNRINDSGGNGDYGTSGSYGTSGTTNRGGGAGGAGYYTYSGGGGGYSGGSGYAYASWS